MLTKLRKFLPLLALLILLAGGVSYWRHQQQGALPAGFTYANGRLEATETDLAAKAAGRVLSVNVREGDPVEVGQILVRLEVSEVAAQYQAAMSQTHQADHGRQEAEAGVRAAQAQLNLARTTLNRNEQLVKKGFISAQQLEQDQNAFATAEANLTAARQKVEEARAATRVASSNAGSVKSVLDDATLRSPIQGRVLYRLTEPGEMLAAGGKALTLISGQEMFMTVFLPETQAGQVALGSEARIVLDALPGELVPAKVSFVSPRNQFTPKEVETRNEREKLMFRVKLQVDEAWLRQHQALAKPGMPGVGYLRLTGDQPWPAHLAPR